MPHTTPPRNALAGETSPYLLDHAGDPVAWQPWGRIALDLARAEDKPIFLSIGYSACHWCHVMQHESFQSERVARVLSEHFICIKVDREERPDLDELYMAAVQQLTGSGGRPLSVFLTPTGEPFHGGTYFPPARTMGRPSFLDVLAGVLHAWRERREKLVSDARRISATIARSSQREVRAELDPQVLERSLAALEQNFDPRWGGFGDAPKFPRATDLRLCLRHHLRTGKELPLSMARLSLERMANGGIHDQLGGGFHRYSTDERWLVPHFEKMLYDNALLAQAFLEGFLATKDTSLARAALSIFDWVEHEMVTREGGFASSQDADSGGEEGSFYVWTPAELRQVLGSRLASWASEWWGVQEGGNFEQGASVLWREHAPETVAERLRVDLAVLEPAIAAARGKLLAARTRRTRPATDDKVLASWNGLMVSALAQAAQVLDEERFGAMAVRAMRFLLGHMRTVDGRLFATARVGRARQAGTLADYVYVIQALVDLYEMDFDAQWIKAALELSRLVSRHFADLARGGYFDTPDDHEVLFARLATPQDGALPSPAGMHVLNLLRLAQLTGESALAKEAEQALLSQGGALNLHPALYGQYLLAVDFLAAPPYEIVLAGEERSTQFQALLRAVRTAFRPQRVVAFARKDSDAETIGLLQGRSESARPARAFLCRNWACRAPIEDPALLARELAE